MQREPPQYAMHTSWPKGRWEWYWSLAHTMTFKWWYGSHEDFNIQVFWICFVVSHLSSLIHLLWTVQRNFHPRGQRTETTVLVCDRGGMPGYGEKDCASTGYFAHRWLDFPFAHQHYWCWVCAEATQAVLKNTQTSDHRLKSFNLCFPFLGLSKSFKRCHVQRSTSKDGVFKIHNSVARPEEEVRIPTRIVNLGVQQWQT